MSLHMPRPPRRPGHPDSGRCATILDDDTRCPEAPAFEVECAECGVYFEVCVSHRMDLAGEWGITCPECDSVSFYLTMMS